MSAESISYLVSYRYYERRKSKILTTLFGFKQCNSLIEIWIQGGDSLPTGAKLEKLIFDYLMKTVLINRGDIKELRINYFIQMVSI